MAFKSFHRPKSARDNYFKHNPRHRFVPEPLPSPSASQRRIENIVDASILATESKTDVFCVENVRCVAGYSWTTEEDATILVPGKPPRWSPPSITQQLRQDHGQYYRDPNSAHHPSFPSEPALKALQHSQSDFKLSSIDVLGCGNTIGSLLSFAAGEDRTFRFGVELLGSTLILVRKTNHPKELIEDVRGYGHTFPEAYTQWDSPVTQSTSHQRIIQYYFAGLRFCVRSECDGYLPALIDRDEEEPRNLDKQGQDKDETQDSVDDTINLLRKSLGLAKKSTTQPGENVLNLVPAGGIVPQHAIFDLKTRSSRNEFTSSSADAFLQRLWVTQTPNLILAYHTQGTFLPKDIHIVDVKAKLSDWESKNSQILSQLYALLQKLRKVAEKSGSRLEIRRFQQGPLEIWTETENWSALPQSLKDELGFSKNGNGVKEADGEADGCSGDSLGSDNDEDAYLRY